MTTEPSNRTLHVIDIENLVGDGFPTAEQTRQALLRYRVASGWSPTDHILLACNRYAARVVGFAAASVVPHVLVVGKTGPDAADIALSAAFWNEPLDRYQRVCIGSGDGYFGPIVEHCNNAHIPVNIYARPGTVSNSYAQRITHLLAA